MQSMGRGEREASLTLLALPFQSPWNAYRPIILDLMEARGNFRHPDAFAEYLGNVSHALPNGSLTAETAYNFTEVNFCRRPSTGALWQLNELNFPPRRTQSQGPDGVDATGWH